MRRLYENAGYPLIRCATAMTTRIQRQSIFFHRSFVLNDRSLPPGRYEIATDEELIEGLSFVVYRRISTSIFVRAQSHRASSIEMVTIDPSDLQAAHDRDAAAHQLATPANGRS